MASLAVGCALRGSPEGSVGWGVILVLSGALLFLYSSRQRKILMAYTPWCLGYLFPSFFSNVKFVD